MRTIESQVEAATSHMQALTCSPSNEAVTIKDTVHELYVRNSESVTSSTKDLLSSSSSVSDAVTALEVNDATIQSSDKTYQSSRSEVSTQWSQEDIVYLGNGVQSGTDKQDGLDSNLPQPAGSPKSVSDVASQTKKLEQKGKEKNTFESDSRSKAEAKLLHKLKRENDQLKRSLENVKKSHTLSSNSKNIELADKDKKIAAVKSQLDKAVRDLHRHMRRNTQKSSIQQEVSIRNTL